MKTLSTLLFWVATLPLVAQSPQTFEIAGKLRLIDKPPEATPVEALSFQIHSLTGGPDIYAQPDREGNFVLGNVQMGRYSLTFPMPGRLAVFAIGTKELSPNDFELTSDDPAHLSIVVSMKSATVAVKVRDFRSDQSNTIALLVPYDDRLTLQVSCYSNRLIGPETIFRFVPIGRYRILVFNEKYLRDVSAYAPRVSAFLGHESVTIEASSEKDPAVSASFITDEAVEAAINAAGGPFNPFSRPRGMNAK